MILEPLSVLNWFWPLTCTWEACTSSVLQEQLHLNKVFYYDTLFNKKFRKRKSYSSYF